VKFRILSISSSFIAQRKILFFWVTFKRYYHIGCDGFRGDMYFDTINEARDYCQDYYTKIKYKKVRKIMNKVVSQFKLPE
jgi:hypothetical protein